MKHPLPWWPRGGPVVVASALAAGGALAAPTVRLCMPDIELPPYSHRAASEPGLLDRLLQDASRAAGLKLSIERMPSARCRQALLQGDMDAMPLPAIPAYMAEMDFPMQQGRLDRSARLLRLPVVLLRRRGEAQTWDGQRLSPPGLKVGTRLGLTTLADRLLALGAELDDKAFTNEQLLGKLLAGRIDLVAMSQPEFEALQSSRARASQLEALPIPLLEMELYLAFSRRLQHVPAERLQAWREQLKRLRESPAYQP